MKNDGLFDKREYYPLKWWQLWRWNGYWQNYTFRYKWVRSIYDKYIREQSE